MMPWRHGRHGRESVMTRLFQQSFLLTVSGGISAAGGFVAWTVATHAATPHAVGLAAGLFASCSLLSYLTSLALPYGLLRYGHSTGAPLLLRLALSVTAATSVIGAAVFALGTPWWAPALSSELVHPAGMATYAAFNVAVAVSVIVDTYFVARRHAGLACSRNGIAAVGKVGGILILAMARVVYANAIYVAMLAPVAVSVVCVSLPLVTPLRAAANRDDPDLSREFIRFSLKTYPGALLDGAPIFLLPVLALRLVGPTANAYFYVAWSIAGVVGLLSSAIGQVTLREAATPDNRQHLARRAKALAVTVTGLAVLAFYLAARFVLQIFGPRYISATVPLRLLLLSTLPGAHLTITIALLRGRKLYRAVNQASIAYAALSIGATVGFGAIAGTTGLCLGWLIGVSLTALVAAFIAARQPIEASTARYGSMIAPGGTDDPHAA